MRMISRSKTKLELPQFSCFPYCENLINYYSTWIFKQKSCLNCKSPGLSLCLKAFLLILSSSWLDVVLHEKNLLHNRNGKFYHWEIVTSFKILGNARFYKAHVLYILDNKTLWPRGLQFFRPYSFVLIDTWD